jgi:hypothetical protein
VALQHFLGCTWTGCPHLWHNWALFSWTDTDGTPVCIPGQIITFIWFAEEDISKIQHLPYVSGDTPGLYAMIETLELPLMVAKTYDRVGVGGNYRVGGHRGFKRSSQRAFYQPREEEDYITGKCLN